VNFGRKVHMIYLLLQPYFTSVQGCVLVIPLVWKLNFLEY